MWNPLRDYQRALFYRSLSNSCEAGLSPLRALEILARTPAAGAVAADLAGQLSAGVPFSQAMRRHPGFFAGWECEVAAAGETTGRLDKSFRNIAEVIEDRRRFVLTVLGGLAYPLVILHIAPFFLFGPRLYNGDVAGFLACSLGLLAVLYLPAALAWAGWIFWIKGSTWAPRLPLVRTFVKSQFCFYLSSLVASGVSFNRALEVAATASGLGGTGAAGEAATLGLADRLRLLDLFDGDEMGRLESAEAAGSVDKALEQLSLQAQAGWQGTLKVISALLPPGIYLLILLAVAWRILGFWQGYYGALDQFMK